MGGLPYASSSTDFFHEFVNSFGMIDLGFIGNPFTWSNHRDGHQLIRQRLDRGMASSQWVHLFPSFSILHLPASAFDYNPLFLNTVHYDSTLARPFKFEEFWSHHPDCYSTISLAWSPPCFGSPGFILNQKLRSTKLALKLWNRISFGNIQHQILSLTSQLDALQQSTSLSTLSVQERVIKRRRTAIDFLKLSSGAWNSDRQAIGNTLCAHFADLLTTSEPLIPDEMLNLFDTIISNEDNLSICSIPSEQEIHDSVFSIGATKAPGPDEFTGVFYQKYWIIIKPVVQSCVWNFFNKHHLLKEHNHTFIALVPKQLGPSMESMGLLKGICITKSWPPINHLLFVDNLIIFAKATSAEAIALSDCHHKYCCWSGQKVNSGKSSLLFSKNTSPASISSILGIIPFRLSPSRPFHLGLPLTLGSSRKEAFQPIIDKVLSKINGWRAKTLSQAGRTVLIRSTAAAIPAYAMSTFLLPFSLCRQLDRRFKDFWWGFPPDKNRMRCWNKRLLSDLFDPVSAMAVCRLPISDASQKGYLWIPSTSGRFSTSSAYLSILTNDFTGSHLSPLSSFWRDIWKLQLTDRLRIFIWKIAWNIFPTTLRLQSVIPTYRPDASCPLCQGGPDSIRH
ncbi:uncharacterized protein LOC133860458 [Alnus glutinosa]|uniref:uncharacterized protein LOC133860458 n=1 Tax=Alnus glutinosa TaxID=3517 RepID=UPI002D7740E7|nr:uncharacterized protein LOC133860458 [Alnus glutinosa]